MLGGSIARLRLRRPTAVIAAGLVALQAFLAGLAAAQAAAVLTPSLADVAVICHGGGGSDPDHGGAPDPIKASHLCCLACAAAGPPVTLAQTPIVLRSVIGRNLQLPPIVATAVPIAARAKRDGPSQAPPMLA
jgi:hypothetical protein